jgi:hypothetical protein
MNHAQISSCTDKVKLQAFVAWADFLMYEAETEGRVKALTLWTNRHKAACNRLTQLI